MVTAPAAASPSVSLNQHLAMVLTQRGVSLNSTIRVFSSSGFTTRISSSSAVAVELELRTPTLDDTEAELFAYPICYEPLIRKGPSGFNVPAIYRSGFKCRKCNKSYSSKNIYLDLTVTSGTKEYNESKPTRTELFRSPVVSFLYERGWRQAFNQGGFPGPDEEFNMAQEYFKVAEAGVLVDVSCGSGLFSRKFAKSGVYSRVIALDFSENMLRQCYDFIKPDESILSSNLVLVRADVSRLPFFSGSVDAVHTGAALHCWPSPSNALKLQHKWPFSFCCCQISFSIGPKSTSSFFSWALADDKYLIAEINRILRSGGVIVGTTFLPVNPSAPPTLRALQQQSATRTYSAFTQKEIEDLVTSCGLVNYTSKVQGLFIMFSAQKR